MKQILVVAAFTALASAISPVAACDWEHEASTTDQTVAADQTKQAPAACTGAECSTPQPTGVASEQASGEGPRQRAVADYPSHRPQVTRGFF